MSYFTVLCHTVSQDNAHLEPSYNRLRVCVCVCAAWMPGQSMTHTNPGLESLKAGGPLSADLFAGDSSVPSTTGTVPPWLLLYTSVLYVHCPCPVCVAIVVAQILSAVQSQCLLMPAWCPCPPAGKSSVITGNLYCMNRFCLFKLTADWSHAHDACSNYIDTMKC